MKNGTRKSDIEAEIFERQASICKAFANPTRLHLLDLLGKGERGASELQEELGLPTLSKRLLRVYRVNLPSGLSLAEELVRRGYAWPDPDAGAALERLSILGAATEARVQSRGCVWGVGSEPPR